MQLTSHTAATKIRELSLKLVHKAKASHIGSALSIADILAVLITNSDIFNLSNPQDEERDRLMLSKGHACVALYSALCLKGYFDESELMTYGEDFSPFMNHSSHHVPGIDFSTGALGHALPCAVGRALAAKNLKKEWRTFVIMSDGELQEGSNWEAFMFASHHELKNICVLIDNNNLQSLDTVERTLSLEPLSEKLRAFGWYVSVCDGHDHEEIYKHISDSNYSRQPSAIILKTIKGKGISFMENSVEWHYKSPTTSQLLASLKELSQ